WDGAARRTCSPAFTTPLESRKARNGTSIRRGPLVGLRCGWRRQMSLGPTSLVSGRYSGLDVGQAAFVGVQRHLRPVGELELPEDVRDVRLDRPLADLQLGA